MNEELLIKYLTNTANSDDLICIRDWMKLSQANSNWLFEMERVWSLKNELKFSDKECIEQAYNNFLSALEDDKVNKSSLLSIFKRRFQQIAAVFIIGLMLSTIYLTTTASSTMNVIEVPKGETAIITLSDGTKVWLNSNSKLSYPSKFSWFEREVDFIGEGYFEVSHNKRVPFMVNTSDIEVKVLGTKFNLKTYDGESSFVTLTEGKVLVKSQDNDEQKMMKPNDHLEFNQQNEFILKENVDVIQISQWKTGSHGFNNQSLSDIATVLSRKYDVEIKINDKRLENEIFTCRTHENITLIEILELLRNTGQLDYKILNDKSILILRNQLME